MKFRLYEMDGERLLAHGMADRLGEGAGHAGSLSLEVAGREPLTEPLPGAGHEAALARILTLLGESERPAEPDAIGHRVVHGGELFRDAVPVTEEVLAAIERCAALAPLHNPPNLTGIRACARLLPHVPQVAVFDTAFHATLPERSYLYAIPYDWYRRFGARRYGFHGISHAYVTARAGQMLGRDDMRIVSCHLGNGCSMAAVRAGRSIDTSMGMTPLEGLVMGTRSGDLDPALVPVLAQWLGEDAAGIVERLNEESGLLGVSQLTRDMRDLEALMATQEHGEAARRAFDLFCYRVRKYVGAYAAALGGLDTLVFTAGIGENSPAVRRAVCAELGFLGIELDHARNEETAGAEREIATPGARVRVLVIPTNEELMIARETARVVGG